MELAQQGWPASPQPTHVPPTQIEASPKRLQRSSAQQGWPTCPQGRQVPWAQTRPWEEVPVQVAPAQHGWFCPPHATQVPLLQTVPDPAHVAPAQQG